MCQFKSAIVLKDETRKTGYRLLMSAWTDSHSDLIALNNLNDGGHLRFARVEFLPSEDLTKLDDYKLKIDEERTPDWFDSEMSEDVAKVMRRYVEKMIIVDGEHRLLLGGEYIVGGNAQITEVKNARVHSLGGEAHVEYIYGSASVGAISGSASVEYISGSAKIEKDERVTK